MRRLTIPVVDRLDAWAAAAWVRIYGRVDCPTRLLWGSLHEPRPVTALYVVTYLLAAVAGVGMMSDTIPTVLPHPWDFIEGGIMVACGLVGAPAAWVGRWWLERIACFALGTVAAFLLAGTIVDYAHLQVVLDSGITASWVFGSWMWIVACVVRWHVSVSRSPYAPGKGPLASADWGEQLIALARQIEEVVNSRQGK